MNWINQIFVFLLTLGETLVVTWENRADRQVTRGKNYLNPKMSLKAALWAGLFDVLLIVDVILVQESGWELVPTVFLGAAAGKLWALEKRRLKWKNQQFKKAEKEDNDEEDDE